jgi:plastocyanin
MRLRLASAAAVLLTFALVSLLPLSHPVVAQVNSNDNRISIMDNCLPGDPGWTPTGGCSLAPHQGEVSAAEFGAFIPSTLISAFVGHPSWRNEPSYLSVDRGKTIRVTNTGGRGHTFTRVAEFGGGSVAGFNIGATRAPECPATPPEVKDASPPGGSIEIQGLAPNPTTPPSQASYKFQCCFHPWMRAAIKVE